MTDLAGLAAALTIAALVFRRAGALRAPASLLAALPGLALGSLSIAAFALLFVGIRLAPLPLALAFAGVLAYLASITRRWYAGAPLPPSPAVSFAPPLPRAVWGLVAVTALFTLWAAWRWIGAWPHGTADAVNIWTSRALLLVRADGDIVERLALMRGGHPDYPLLLPTSLAAQYGASGGESLLIPQATSVVWFVAVVAATFTIARHLTNPLMGTLAALAVATNPLLTRWGFVQIADVALAYFLLLSAGSMAVLSAADGRPIYAPPLAGFFVGLLPWTKNEGIVLAAVLIGLAAVFSVARRDPAGDARRRSAFFALGIAPPLTALLLFRVFWTRDVEVPSFMAADWLQRILDVDRWRVLLSTAAYEATYMGRMRVSAALLLALMAVVLVLLVRRRRALRARTWFLFAVPAAVAPCYATAYLLSPYDLQWHVSTSIDRLLLHVMPVVVVGAAVLVAAPDRLNSSASAAVDGGSRDPV